MVFSILQKSVLPLVLFGFLFSCGFIEASSTSDKQLVVYYFHTNKRCKTCRNLENYAKESLQKNFSQQLGEGTIRWEVVNIDKSGNEHFVEEYGLFSSSIVLVKMKGNQPGQWKNLSRIWSLVKNKKAYMDYIHENIESFY